ncbi:hypothetical protein CRM22_008938 [Opisthorchis felineus]|uniref:Uncharacterized protein n=1 Tax=Opisthorchis felineus TaxID=147828 RepID=A0A4S2L9N5_OPIFE|nr:hypothetical protein CRM22_008938 [Opisthorchis felineus]
MLKAYFVLCVLANIPKFGVSDVDPKAKCTYDCQQGFLHCRLKCDTSDQRCYDICVDEYKSCNERC